MDCLTEEGLLRQALGRIPGVGQLEFNLVQRRLRVAHSLGDPAAIVQLHLLGIRTVMLRGDNAVTAMAIAQQVGIDDAQGYMLPEDKLSAINDEVARFGTVGMVGDGINDAPALAKADIGFAMSAAGTDTAIETADVALMDDDLRKIPQFIRLSRQAAAILKQNIVTRC